MGGTAVPKKLYYRIGEACRAVDIQPYVLRYWETEFEALAPGKSKSGQRVYTEQELGVIRRIKELLYEEGYTIAGAKKRLQTELEEGRSFASPEVAGELFEGGEGAEGAQGEDEGPATTVEATSEEENEPDTTSVPEPTSVWDSSGEFEPASESEPVAESPATREPQPDSAPIVAAAAEPGPARKRESTRRTKSRAKREVDAPEVGVAAASAPPDARPSAVDSALTDRVETLEHGLRRVLAEVRQLRGLLADSGSER